jgi:hypothetical protein
MTWNTLAFVAFFVSTWAVVAVARLYLPRWLWNRWLALRLRWHGLRPVGGGAINYPVFSDDAGSHAIQRFRQIISPAIVATVTTAEQSFVVPALNPPSGVTVTEATAFVSKPTAQAGLGIAGARVIDSTHIGVTFVNPTAGGLTPTAAEAYQFTVVW